MQMNITAIALAIGTVAGMAAGQVLFKLAATRGNVVDILAAPALWAGLVLYGAVTLMWVLLLRQIDLARAYPFIAFTFILVPALSVLLLGERVGPYYALGVALIVAGIMLTIWA
jgi:undecaprenyl phosphate-alpha-L-ara4N flippase subunit ArnE